MSSLSQSLMDFALFAYGSAQTHTAQIMTKTGLAAVLSTKSPSLGPKTGSRLFHNKVDRHTANPGKMTGMNDAEVCAFLAFPKIPSLKPLCSDWTRD